MRRTLLNFPLSVHSDATANSKARRENIALEGVLRKLRSVKFYTYIYARI